SVRFDRELAECQAEAGGVVRRAAPSLDPAAEFLEDPAPGFRRHAASLIVDRNSHASIVPSDRDPDSTAGRRVLNAVADQILQHSPHEIAIAAHSHGVGACDLDGPGAVDGAERGTDVACDVRHVPDATLDRHPAFLETTYVEEFIGHPA